MIVVGAGEISRQLVRRLGEAWDVTIVDSSKTRLGEVEADRPFRTVHGDGSSRLVLKKAGLEEADALVAATDDDESNLEVCRLGKEARVRRLVAVAADPARLSAYREMEVPAFSAPDLAARQMELHLEPRRGVSTTFAEGKVEAMEFRVATNSPMRGRSVRELGSSPVVATVLRGGELLVADGQQDLHLEAGDLVTVMGPATELPEIVRSFTAAAARFPLDHGKRIAVALEGDDDLGSSFREAVVLTRNSRATSLLALHPAVDPDEEDEASLIRNLVEEAEARAEEVQLELRGVEEAPEQAVLRLPESESIGVVVLRRRSGAFRRLQRPVALARRLATPILFSRGKRAHRRILVAARRTPAGRAAAQAAVDLAEIGKADLTAMAVVDPQFMAGPAAEEESSLAIDQVKELGAVHGVEVRDRIEHGNPVRAFLEASERADLVVLGLAGRRLGRPTLASRLAHESVASVMVVPTRE